MPWTVHVEDERGKLDSVMLVVIEFGSLPTGLQFPVSSLIEASPYYDTLLNPVQVNALIEELNLSSNAHVEGLLELAKQASKPHMYLRFIGD